jgi:predicted RNA-binding Zn ribbon-like protein
MSDSHEKKFTRGRPLRFELVAGSLCLDFINTLDDRFSSPPKELLEHYVDLARFGEDTQILTTPQVDRLMAWSMRDKEGAQRAFRAGIQLREAMHEVFWAIVNRKSAPQLALITLNRYAQVAAQHSQLVPVNGHFEWRFDEPGNNFQAPLWPIARSAADLLASEHLDYVRACASPTCQWLFLDASKNHRRRWCDMKQCGNRAKVSRFYRRKNKSSAQG